MKNCWKFTTPKYLKEGNDTAHEALDFLTETKCNKTFYVVDPLLFKKNANIQKIIEQAKRKGGVMFKEFTTNPTIEHVTNSTSVYRKFMPDSVVAIGGGSAIDLAKATMLAGVNDGVIQDYLAGKRGSEDFPFFIAIPSTCGTGSEASPYAVITDPGEKKKRGIKDYNFLPDLVILDPQLLISLDKEMIAATGIDALTHIVESFISKKASELTRSSARGLLVNYIPSLEKASFNKDVNSLRVLMDAAFSSRLLYPRTGLTIAHALSHPLGAYTRIHHGIAVSFFLPQSLIFNNNYCNKELREVFNILGFDSLENFVSWFDVFSEKIGITRIIQSKLIRKRLTVMQLASDAMESSNIPSNPRPTSKQSLELAINKSFEHWGLK